MWRFARTLTCSALAAAGLSSCYGLARPTDAGTSPADASAPAPDAGHITVEGGQDATVSPSHDSCVPDLDSDWPVCRVECGHDSCATWAWWLPDTAGGGCVCFRECEVDEDCPASPEPGFQVRCTTQGLCGIRCRDLYHCPEGMVCLHDSVLESEWCMFR